MNRDTARSLIETQIAAHTNGVMSVLAKYRLSEAVQSLHATIRAVEEFINVPRFNVDDIDDRKRLLSISLDEAFFSNPAPAFQHVTQILSQYVEPDIILRYRQTMLCSAAIGMGFRQHARQDFEAGRLLANVGSAAHYYQTRRRHLVSLLYTMPGVCLGREQLSLLDTLNVLLPQIEHSCATITGLHQKMVLMDVFEEFQIEPDTTGFSASHIYHSLETDFLEPERASIMTMYDLRREQIIDPDLEPVAPKRVFSAAELRNNLKLLCSCYAAFDLDDAQFSALTQMIKFFIRYCRDDYYIDVPFLRFISLLRSQSAFDPDEIQKLLLNTSSDYTANTNAYHPFIRVGDTAISNVNLLSRFMYAFKNIHLGSRKRFQIHAGFIFEDMVKRDLNRLGFTVTDIKRLNRKEFDVVTILNGVIHNFQCKNNALDLTLVESNRNLFVRYNRSMVNYYQKALTKEEGREKLLKVALGLDRIEHYVVSRFPVVTEDPRIINYNQLSERLKPVVAETR